MLKVKARGNKHVYIRDPDLVSALIDTEDSRCTIIIDGQLMDLWEPAEDVLKKMQDHETAQIKEAQQRQSSGLSDVIGSVIADAMAGMENGEDVPDVQVMRVTPDKDGNPVITDVTPLPSDKKDDPTQH